MQSTEFSSIFKRGPSTKLTLGTGGYPFRFAAPRHMSLGRPVCLRQVPGPITENGALYRQRDSARLSRSASATSEASGEEGGFGLSSGGVQKMTGITRSVSLADKTFPQHLFKVPVNWPDPDSVNTGNGEAPWDAGSGITGGEMFRCVWRGDSLLPVSSFSSWRRRFHDSLACVRCFYENY